MSLKLERLKAKIDELEKKQKQDKQKLKALEKLFTEKLADAIEEGFSRFEIVATEKETTEQQIKELINGQPTTNK